MADVFAKMLREMKAANSPRLIIDLRGNGGGWTMIMYAALYELYGKRIMDTDLGMHFATKVSDGWLKKNNLTLEQLNQDRGTLLKMGDFIERPSNISSFDWFMCADMSILEAQDGEPIYTPEEIYVVTDVQTFSSAFHTAYMLWKMGAKVVGVTSGQAPNTFMEVLPPTHSRVASPQIILWQRLSLQTSNCRMMTITSSTSVRMQNYCISKSNNETVAERHNAAQDSRLFGSAP